MKQSGGQGLIKLLRCGVTSSSCSCAMLTKQCRHKLDKVHDTVLKIINCKGEECAGV